MKKALLSGLGLLFLASMVSAQAMAAKAGGASTPDELRQRWVAAANAKDAAGLTALYTDDAMVMPSNAPTAKGRTAVQGVWKGLMDQGAHDITLTKVSGAMASDWGYEVGTYSAMFGTSQDKGKYMLSLKKGKDGKWLIQEDIFNSDMPCAAPAGAPAR
jgi:ketosteroid isomerase-like protein